MQTLKDKIRIVSDFPSKWINFLDLTTLFSDHQSLEKLKSETVSLYKDKNITKVVCIESRGYILGSILANELGAGIVLARNPGKLPWKTAKAEYKKEYGTDSVEIHTDSITEDDVVLIHDDILATGGTLKAVTELVRSFKPKAIYINVIVEIESLSGRSHFLSDTPLESILKF